MNKLHEWSTFASGSRRSEFCDPASNLTLRILQWACDRRGHGRQRVRRAAVRRFGGVRGAKVRWRFEGRFETRLGDSRCERRHALPRRAEPLEPPHEPPNLPPNHPPNLPRTSRSNLRTFALEPSNLRIYSVRFSCVTMCANFRRACRVSDREVVMAKKTARSKKKAGRAKGKAAKRTAKKKAAPKKAARARKRPQRKRPHRRRSHPKKAAPRRGGACEAGRAKEAGAEADRCPRRRPSRCCRSCPKAVPRRSCKRNVPDRLPSPIAHALGAAAAGWSLSRPESFTARSRSVRPRSSRRSAWRPISICSSAATVRKPTASAPP